MPSYTLPRSGKTVESEESLTTKELAEIDLQVLGQQGQQGSSNPLAAIRDYLTKAVSQAAAPVFAPPAAMRNLPAGAQASPQEMQQATQTAQSRGQMVGQAVVPQTVGDVLKLLLTAGAGPVAGAMGAGPVVQALTRMAVPGAVDTATGNLGAGTLLETGLMGAAEVGTGLVNRLGGLKYGKGQFQQYANEKTGQLAGAVATDIPILQPKLGTDPSSLHDMFAAKSFSNTQAGRMIGDVYQKVDDAVDAAVSLTGAKGIDTRQYPNLAKVAGDVKFTQSGQMGAFGANWRLPTVKEVQSELKKARGRTANLEPTAENKALRDQVDAAHDEYSAFVKALDPGLAQAYSQVRSQYRAASWLHRMLGPEAKVWEGGAKGPFLNVPKAQEMFGGLVNDADARSLGNTITALSGPTAGSIDEVTNVGLRLGIPPLVFQKGYTGIPLDVPVMKPAGWQPGTREPVTPELLMLLGLQAQRSQGAAQPPR